MHKITKCKIKGRGVMMEVLAGPPYFLIRGEVFLNEREAHLVRIRRRKFYRAPQLIPQ